MAIYSVLSKFVRSTEFPLATGATVDKEGAALVRDTTGGAFGVKQSTGAAGETFVGFTLTQTSAASFVPSNTPRVEEFTVPTGGVLTLARTPLASTVSVYNATDNAQVAGASVTVSGRTVTLTGVDGKAVHVTYRHALSVTEARMMFGDQQPGGYSGNLIGATGAAQEGVIYTTEFDTAKDYRAATALKLASGGLVTDQSGTGATIAGAYVVAFPSLEYPYLGIAFSAA